MLLLNIGTFTMLSEKKVSVKEELAKVNIMSIECKKSGNISAEIILMILSTDIFQSYCMKQRFEKMIY